MLLDDCKRALVLERSLRIGEYGYTDAVGNRPFPERDEATRIAKLQLEIDYPELAPFQSNRRVKR